MLQGIARSGAGLVLAGVALLGLAGAAGPAPAATVADGDADGIHDDLDNCPASFNPDQDDSDGDGAGDACDPDDDGDRVPDASDNCPLEANPGQDDDDRDLLGNVCDASFDAGAAVAAIEADVAFSVGQIAAANPPGGSRLIAMLTGDSGLLEKLAEAVEPYAADAIGHGQYVERLNVALRQLNLYTRHISASLTLRRLPSLAAALRARARSMREQLPRPDRLSAFARGLRRARQRLRRADRRSSGGDRRRLHRRGRRLPALGAHGLPGRRDPLRRGAGRAHTGGLQRHGRRLRRCSGRRQPGGGGIACPTGLPGLCGSGQTSCVQAQLRCIPDRAGVTELCNNLDDDCDVAVDERFPEIGQPCAVGAGVARTPARWSAPSLSNGLFVRSRPVPAMPARGALQRARRRLRRKHRRGLSGRGHGVPRDQRSLLDAGATRLHRRRVRHALWRGPARRRATALTTTATACSTKATRAAARPAAGAPAPRARPCARAGR